MQTKWEQILASQMMMSKKQQRLCRYIQNNLQEIGVLTARQLAEQAGVGEATVFRFLKEMGYDSYGEFRGEVHRYAVEHTQSSYWQMKAALQGTEQRENTLYQHILETLDLLQRSMNVNLERSLLEAADIMLSAAEVGILGLRSSKSPALYLHALLIPFLSSVRQFSYDEHFIFEQIKGMSKGSALFVISSWPNTKTTVQAAQFARQQGYHIILLTNSTLHPLSSLAQTVLLVPESNSRYTIAPYIVVIEALAQEIGRRQAPDSLQKLEEMDRILAKENITDWSEPSGL